MPVKIRVREKGPYVIDDPSGLTIVDHEGNVIPFPVRPGKTNVVLCRCGASTTKPFCDGTHSRIGFLAAEAAVKKQPDG